MPQNLIKLIFVAVSTLFVHVQSALANEFPVGEVKIAPVLFIPEGRERAASRWLDAENQNNVYAYLGVTQKKWEKLLGGKAFSYDKLKVVNGNKSSIGYVNSGNIFAEIQGEVLASMGIPSGYIAAPDVCQFDKIILMLVVGGEDITIGSGGNWCSYGLINGPGASIIGIDHFFKGGKLTSTLVHEVGHSLGLPHIWQRPSTNSSISSAYPDFGQHTSTSVMSYNLNNQTNTTNVNQVPGTLMPVERFELSHNKRALPYYQFKGVLSLTEQWFATFFRHPILAIGSNYDIYNMWRSPKTNSLGWVSFGMTLPRAEYVDRITVETGTNLNQFRADKIQIEVADYDGNYNFVAAKVDGDGSATVQFPKVRGQSWKIAMHRTPGTPIDLRGVRFFISRTELYPPK